MRLTFRVIFFVNRPVYAVDFSCHFVVVNRPVHAVDFHVIFVVVNRPVYATDFLSHFFC